MLKSLAKQSGESMPAVLDRAIESYRRQRFLEGLNEDFKALRGNAKAWKQELDERSAWDAALSDGLEEK
jgi:hypothetical protein